MKTTIVALLTLFSPLLASADDIIKLDVKPGLWETSTKTEMSGMPAMQMPQIPEETLAKMPPEQRARVEAMMKGRGMGGPMSNTSRSCQTRETIDKGFGQRDQACTYKVTNSLFAKQEIHVDCTRNGSKQTGDIVLQRADPEHVTGTALMKGSMGNGGEMTIKVAYDAKWISSDCGSIKPGDSEPVKK